MFEQLGLIHIVHTDVVIFEKSRKEIVDLPCHVEDIADPGDMQNTQAKIIFRTYRGMVSRNLNVKEDTV